MASEMSVDRPTSQVAAGCCSAPRTRGVGGTGSTRTVCSRLLAVGCVIMLTLLSGSLFLVKDTQLFWFIAILIGFFIGPIQASSRSFISKKVKGNNQLSVFSFYSFLGNICSVMGPLAVGLLINITDSIRLGMLIIPLFFIISLIPYTIKIK